MSSYKSETADIHSAVSALLIRQFCQDPFWSMADSKLAFVVRRIRISVASRYAYIAMRDDSGGG